jgi:hypothetical protein
MNHFFGTPGDPGGGCHETGIGYAVVCSANIEPVSICFSSLAPSLGAAVSNVADSFPIKESATKQKHNRRMITSVVATYLPLPVCPKLFHSFERASLLNRYG